MRSSLPPANSGRRTTTNRQWSLPSASPNSLSSHSSRPLTHRPTQNHRHRNYLPNSNSPPDHRPDRGPTTRIKPNFVVHLVHPRTAAANTSDGQSSFSVRKRAIIALASLCGIPEDSVHVPQLGRIAGSFGFRQWIDALSAVVSLWEFRLRGKHGFVPQLVPNVIVPSDEDELRDRLRDLFSSHVLSLLENGEGVEKVRREIDERSRRIESYASKRGLRVEVFEKKKALEAERDLVVKRLEEFKIAMMSIVKFLNRSDCSEVDREDDVDVFSLEGDYDWPRIHCLIRRECRRLDDGLPIYAHRRTILKKIHSQQVTVLIGETGSGKSTQLVQFLADSGIAASESIVCTQPRKIAALTLADRVREESNGCYEEVDSVSCAPAFSSATEQTNSKVVFMTDNCLLQHYIKDKSLSGVSCVIIDEAHERSLNTDLLLASLKDLLCRRVDLRLVIMSATADACQLSEYFFGCEIIRVNGRNFPVEIIYSLSSDTEEGTSVVGGRIAPYADDVVKMAMEVHKTEKEGTILAFLTSQAEVEWACERFIAPSAVALPLHGKLSFEEQFRVFQNHPGRRKVIFATNIAETSLTIPGVRYVIDSGMVKESKYEARTGMSILKVCRVSKSSAQQRAGRAGRTEAGRCYRLYSKHEFGSMSLNQEPEIRRVHLGVALLRILALGVDNIADFDFVDAPDPAAVAMAVKNLVQLGAVVEKNGILKLTQEGHCLVKLGLEPKLGKLILGCFRHRMGKEGIVLAAVMANASSIFCRVGNLDDKMKADCLKVKFCNHNGDLFTLLSVYKEWASLPRERRNKWCWENSLNAKSMRRCEDTVKELEICIERELSLVIPGYWVWNPTEGNNKHDKHLKMVILASLAENVAMYTGYDQLGYEVALTGQQARLHPSCSLLAFGQKPNWVVFGELLSVVDQYLVCVTAFDFEALSILDPPPPFDASHMDELRLRVKKVAGCGSTLLKRFCGKSNRSLVSIVSRARSLCEDERINIQVDVDQNEILLYAPPHDMEKVSALVNDALECEKKLMRNECLVKYIYHGRGQVPLALFGSGAQIKHLEVDQRFLTVDVFYYGDNFLDDRELLTFLEKKIDGCICFINKFAGNRQDCDEKEKWGRITFLTPESAMKATEIQKFDLNGSVIKLFPSLSAGGGGDYQTSSFPSVTAMIRWPRRESCGKGVLKCASGDIHSIFAGTSGIMIGTKYCPFETDERFSDSILITGIDKNLLDAEVLDVLEFSTQRTDLEFFLFRRKNVHSQPLTVCKDTLHKRIFACLSSRNPDPNCVRVKVFEPKEKDCFVRALITFDGRLHLEAAKALQELDGKVLLPISHPWQRVKCEQKFQSSIICPAFIYNIVRRQLNAKLASFKRQRGCEWHLVPTRSGAYRVKISANATRPISEMRRSLEELIRGRPIKHPGLTPRVLQHLLSREGAILMRRIQQETETCIVLDRHILTVRICGSEEKIAAAEQELVRSLLAYHESKQLEIRLRGPHLRPDLMKEVVHRFGPELQGIKEKVNGVDLKLNTRYHVIHVHGSVEMRQEVEKMVYELAQEGSSLGGKAHDVEVECPICLSEVEDGYSLEGCSHLLCKACLLEQLEASMRNFDAFPIICSHVDCGAPIVLADLRALLSQEKLDELFRASLSSFVTTSDGKFRFCPTPDCPSIYRVAGPQDSEERFICGACNSEICTRCHLEYHSYITCERYKLFKEDPDMSLKDWAKGKNVKECPFCKSTIEKSEGCNHLLCRCGNHICWVCLKGFTQQEPCYEHLRAVHGGIGIFNDLGMPIL
ncbi:ATP-dependent RNA helicase DEAH12 [Hirschfeldia incana]|nr:ATP-dependent RNA helicase DEAH12 [Hirschfeldia incana]